MSSEEGGVARTVSPSSTRRARLRRGTLAGRAVDAVFRGVGRLPDDDFVVVRLAAAFGAALRAPFFRVALRAAGRLAVRPLALFFVERVEAAARPPLRLAIVRCPFE